MGQLNGGSAVSLYYQLKELLLEKITGRVWKPDDKIPSEHELASQYNVSRITVRQALAELEKDGYLVRRQGKGTFVAIPRIEQNLTSFYSFTEEFRKRGYKPSSRVLEFELIVAGPEIAGKLKLTSPSDQVYYIKRLRYADDIVVALESTYLPASLFPGLTLSMIEDKALYDVMRDNFAVIPNSAEEFFGASQLSEKDAVYFQQKKGLAVLDVERFAYCSQGNVEYTKSFVRGDIFRFCVKLG